MRGSSHEHCSRSVKYPWKYLKKKKNSKNERSSGSQSSPVCPKPKSISKNKGN